MSHSYFLMVRGTLTLKVVEKDLVRAIDDYLDLGFGYAHHVGAQGRDWGRTFVSFSRLEAFAKTHDLKVVEYIERAYDGRQDVVIAARSDSNAVATDANQSKKSITPAVFKQQTSPVPPVFFDQVADGNKSDAEELNHWIDRVSNERGGGEIRLGARCYLIDQPLVLKTGVTLRGEGIGATSLGATDQLSGPVIISENAELLQANRAWFYSEGVPVRFGIASLRVDGKDASLTNEFGSGVGIWLYGKAFSLIDVEVNHTKRHGIVSSGSARGGQESWLDEPEAVFDVRISRCGRDGFVMRGPHDSIIRSAIIAVCKGRGLVVEAVDGLNGACDIDFCHAYGTRDVAIDLAAKVKAGFLQGDTGTGAGLRIGGSDKTFIDRVECFKTRGSPDDHALEINAPFTQIGLARVRADWGTGGVHIKAPHVQIGLLDIDGQRGPSGGPVVDQPNATTALKISADHVQIPAVSVRNFQNGVGVDFEGNRKSIQIGGTTMNCSHHVSYRNIWESKLTIFSTVADGEKSDSLKPSLKNRILGRPVLKNR